MANCRICGKPVWTATVMHDKCWKREVRLAASVFCAGYCRWPYEIKDDDALAEKCGSCPLVNLVNAGLGCRPYDEA